MNASLLVFGFFGVAWLLAVLGGLGAGGMGADSRDLGVRERGEERRWRSLLSR
jgi:hypothetical protein